MLRQLDHPNIIRLYDYFRHRSKYHFVLEYIEDTLTKILKDKKRFDQ